MDISSKSHNLCYSHYLVRYTYTSSSKITFLIRLYHNPDLHQNDTSCPFANTRKLMLTTHINQESGSMRSYFLILFLFVLMPAVTSAQFIFQNLKFQDGLSEKEVRCLYKDSDGYLWIGASNGLNRFDGAIIRQYPSAVGTKKLYINAIHPIKNENYLLIGTKEGIRIFNKTNGSFIRDKRFSLLDKETVEVIKMDDQKRFWIVCTSKIFIFHEGRLFPAAALIPSLKTVQNPAFYFNGFVWDRLRRGFWVGGEKTYFIDCENEKVFSKENNPRAYPYLNSTRVEAIVLDKSFNLWYGCNQDQTLHFWDHKLGTDAVENHADGKKAYDGYNCLFIDQLGRLWISTWGFSAYMKEPGKPIVRIPYSQSQNYSIAYGHFRDAIQDTESNVWLGTINGVSKSQSNSPITEIFHIPSFKSMFETGFAHANSIAVDGNLIMACKEEGVVAYDMSNRKYKRYTATQGKDLIKNRFTNATKSKDQWWFSGNDGVYYLDNKLDRLVRFEKIKKNHGSRFATFVITDHKGNVWFHIWSDAIYRYNVDSGICDRFDGTDKKYGLFNYRRVQSALKLRNNDLVFTINREGILKFDAVTEQFTVQPVTDPANFYVTHLAQDKNNDLWAAVYDRGLLKFNSHGQITDSMTTSTGLSLDEINHIDIDDKGTLWASSRVGLEFIDPGTRKETRVQIDLGKTLQDYWNYLKYFEGKIYAVMLDHVVVIDPSQFQSIPVKKPPHITSIRVFQNEKRQNLVNGELQLEANEDYITFQFASLNHRDVPSLQYSYQLDGIDPTWVNAGRTLTASYNQLPHGRYKFRVRTTDEHGRWMKKATVMKLYVEPHWWQSWWAIAFYTLLVLTFSLASYQSYMAKKRKIVLDNTIDYFANSVYGENSVSEICWDIARNCISQLRFEDCVVYLLDKERNIMTQRATYGPKNPKGHEISNPIEIEPGQGIVGTVALTGKALIIKDTSADPRYIVDDEVRLSEIAVPILHEGKVIGVIDSEHRKKDFFTEEHLRVLSTIASISANKIAEAIAEAQAQEKEMKLLEINKMLAESQLMALRAQMNPHFVFNCLNSIQECIVTEKYAEASKYLIKFSKLFRMVLNNSGKNLITIREEYEVLDLYLQLEQMRFDRSFTYKIIIDDELEPDEIMVPSMLMQPYVENALWHGLMHSTSERTLTVEFRLVHDEMLQCRIDDSGIGRKKSFELKKNNSKTKRHESKGLLISQERLAVLTRQGQHAEVKMIDKYDQNDNPTGTLVIIELSTMLQNH